MKPSNKIKLTFSILLTGCAFITLSATAQSTVDFTSLNNGYIDSSTDSVAYATGVNSTALGTITLGGITSNVTLTGGFMYADGSTGSYAQSDLGNNILRFAEQGLGTETYTLSFSNAVEGLEFNFYSLGYTNNGTELKSTWNFGSNTFALVASGSSDPFATPRPMEILGNTISSYEGYGTIRFDGPVSSLTWTQTGNKSDALPWTGLIITADSTSVVAVPEPSSMLLLSIPVCLGLIRRRRR